MQRSNAKVGAGKREREGGARFQEQLDGGCTDRVAGRQRRECHGGRDGGCVGVDDER